MRNMSCFIAVGVVVWVLGFSLRAEAGGKELEAQKRNKFADDSVVSVQESMERQQQEEAAFRKDLLESSREMIELLKDIKAILNEMKDAAEKTSGTAPQEQEFEKSQNGTEFN